MHGFKKVLKFKTWGYYSNVRKIADDIIVSLMVNGDKYENENDNKYRPSYCSTVTESFLCALGDSFTKPVVEVVTEDNNHSDEKYTLWVIRIYECDGNYKSRLSINHNDLLYHLLTNGHIIDEIDKWEEL